MDPLAESALFESAIRLAKQLSNLNLKIVFAESCTAGLVSASLASVPGISQHLCGSAVTYRINTKATWLGIPEAEVERHSAESVWTTQQMAAGVLRNTPQADMATAVTGHLGPNAPTEKDGLIFIAFATRDKTECITLQSRLESKTRVDRQHEAAMQVLEFAASTLERLNDKSV